MAKSTLRTILYTVNTASRVQTNKQRVINMKQTEALRVQKEVDKARNLAIKEMAASIAIYRKNHLSYEEIYSELNGFEKGFETVDQFQKTYIKFINTKALTTKKWEVILEQELLSNLPTKD